jgi:hypothetical protein
MKKNSLFYVYIVVVFLALALGGLSLFLLPGRSYSQLENRYLTKLPQVTWQGILSGQVQRDLTEEASDQLPGRELWLEAATTGQYLLFHREINDVYIGSDDALFNKTLDSDLSVTNFEKNVGYVTAMAADAHTDTSLMLIPSPGTVRSDKLPTRAVFYDSSVYESLGEELCERDSVRFVQTKTALLRAEHENTQTYFNTDHHWNTRGAYLGAQTYLSTQGRELAPIEEFGLETASEKFYGTVAAKVPGLPTVDGDVLELPRALPDGISIETDGAPVDAVDENGERTMPTLDGIYDNAKLDVRDKYAVYFGGNYGKLTVTNPNAAGKGSLLIFKDSYANSMVPYLLDSYETITMIDLRYYNGSVPEMLNEGWDEVLVCYEMSSFINDRNIFKLIR